MDEQARKPKQPWQAPALQREELETYAQLDRCPDSVGDRYIGQLSDSSQEQSCYECC